MDGDETGANRLRMRRRSVSAAREPSPGKGKSMAVPPAPAAQASGQTEEPPRPPTPATSCRLVAFRDVPSWLQDNPAILSGYRRLQYSYRGCWRSLLYLHNETGNIYSHLTGAVVFIGVALATYMWVLPATATSRFGDSFVLSVFFGGAFTCLACSTLFHLFICHSQRVAYAWSKVDYVGIVALIVASFFPITYYSFHCVPHLTWLYLALISALGALGIAVSVFERFGRPEFRVYRTLIFVSMGLSGVVPISHAVLLYGWDYVEKALAFKFMLLMGALYVLGALIYASRVPERWFPGKFDIWLHSHQIFHLLVVAAALVHYAGVMRAHRWWHSHRELAMCSDHWHSRLLV